IERQNVSDPVNLLLENVSLTPPSVRIGEAVTVSWMVRNNQAFAANGTWVDTVFASSDAIWDLSDVVVGQVTHTGGLVPGATYGAQLNFPAPPSVEGDLFFIVRTDSRQQLRESIETDNQSVQSTQLIIPELTLDTVLTSQFTANGQSQ